MKNRIALLGLSLICALPRAAQAQIVTPPIVPPGLEVDAPNQAFLLGHATGFQNYECQPVGSLGRVDWTLFTPQATLFSDQNEQIITHFNSPNPDEARVVRATWQDSTLRDALGSERTRVSPGNIRTRREVRCVCARACSFVGRITRRMT